LDRGGARRTRERAPQAGEGPSDADTPAEAARQRPGLGARRPQKGRGSEGDTCLEAGTPSERDACGKARRDPGARPDAEARFDADPSAPLAKAAAAPSFTDVSIEKDPPGKRMLSSPFAEAMRRPAPGSPARWLARVTSSALVAGTTAGSSFVPAPFWLSAENTTSCWDIPTLTVARRGTPSWEKKSSVSL